MHGYDIGIPGVFGVAVDRISVCLKLKIASGAFMGRRSGIMSPWGVSFWRWSCLCQKLPIVEKVTAEDFGDAKYKMPVRYLLENIHAEPLPKFHPPLLMA